MSIVRGDLVGARNFSPVRFCGIGERLMQGILRPLFFCLGFPLCVLSLYAYVLFFLPIYTYRIIAVLRVVVLPVRVPRVVGGFVPIVVYSLLAVPVGIGCLWSRPF